MNSTIVTVVLLAGMLGSADQARTTGLAAAIRNPAEWDTVFCPIVQTKRKDDEPCHVNTVVEAPQPAGTPIAVVFFDHEFSREYAGPGQARGHFELISADGKLLPIWMNANVLEVTDELIQLDGARLAIAQVVPFEDGVHLLGVTPIEEKPRPLLTVLIGPPLEESQSSEKWGWKRESLGPGSFRISIGPANELNVRPRASFEWKRGASGFDGPFGSPREFFERVPPKEATARVARYVEAADRARLEKRLREAPSSVVQFRIEDEAGNARSRRACLLRREPSPFGPCHRIWSDGLTWFDDVPTGLWILEVRGRDRQVLQQFLTPIPTEPRTFRVRRATARIAVTDARGAPVAGVTLKMMGEGARLSWTTDGKGEAQGTLRPGEYDVSAFVDRNRSIPEAAGVLRAWSGGEGRLSLQIAQGEQLRGRVIDRDARPVAGASVSGVPDVRTANGRGWATARSGADGSFTLGGLTPGPLTLEARSEDGMSLSRVVSSQAPGTVPVTLVLLPRPRLKGRLVTPSGRPVTSFILGESPSERKVSDPDGRFELLLMDGDPELVRFEAEGFGVKWLTAQADLGSEHDLGKVVFLPASVIAGLVTDSGSGRPLAGVHVSEHVVLPERRTGLCGTGYQPPPEGTSWAESKSDGRFRLTSLSSDAVLELSKDGYETKIVEASKLAGPLALERASRSVLKLEGRVVDETGVPSFACVSYRAEFGRGQVFTGVDGFFAIDPPAAGPVTLAPCPTPEGPRFPETVVQVVRGTQRITLQVRP